MSRITFGEGVTVFSPSPKQCWERTSSYITTVYHFMWPNYNISPTWVSLKWEISLTKPPFGVRCEVAIIWPDFISSHFLTLNSWEASLARAMLPALVFLMSLPVLATMPRRPPVSVTVIAVSSVWFTKFPLLKKNIAKRLPNQKKIRPKWKHPP